MAFKCSVQSCNSKSDKTSKDSVSFFEFPSSPTIKQNWLDSIARPYFKPVRSSRMCSKHFDERYFVRNGSQVLLKEDAVPYHMNSPRKSTRRLTLNSSRSSDENISIDDNEQEQPTLGTSGLSIRFKRPRRNTVFTGTYNHGKRHRSKDSTLHSQSSTDEHSDKEMGSTVQQKRKVGFIGLDDLENVTSATSDSQRTNSVSKGAKETVPMLSRSQSSNKESEVTTTTRRKRQAITSLDGPIAAGGTAIFIFKEPKAVAPTLSKKQPRVEKPMTKSTQPSLDSSRGSDDNDNILMNSNNRGQTPNKSNEPTNGMRLRRDTRRPTAHTGPYNFGKRIRLPSATPEKLPTAIQRQPNAAVMNPNSVSQNNLPSTQQSAEKPATVIQEPRAPPQIRRQHEQNEIIGGDNQPTRVSKVTKKPKVVPIRPSQNTIDKFFGKKTTPIKQVVEPRESKREDCIFGYAMMGSHAVPFIVQDSEKLCSLRILEKSVLAKYNKRTLRIDRCHTNIEHFPLTKIHCELLNEINFKHCDGAYGKEKFSTKDKLVRLSDAHKYYTFVDLCHQPLMKGVRVQSEGLEFGFTLVNKKSFIPYVLLNERKFIPSRYLHCDDGIFDVLKGKFEILSDDDALYLKFCCKFDGIVDVDSYNEVIELVHIQNLAPPKTTFKDCWPTDAVNYNLRLVMTTKGIRFDSVQRNLLK